MGPIRDIAVSAGRNVNIVLTTPSIGGTERRMVNIFKELCARNYQNRITLITNQQLVNAVGLKDFQHPRNKVIVLRGSRLRHFIPQIVAKILLNRKDIYHFPLNYFFGLGTLLGSRLRISYTDDVPIMASTRFPSFIIEPAKSAGLIDVLDPRIAKEFRTLLGPQEGKVWETPGSFVHQRFREVNKSKLCENRVQFVGRLTPTDVKNVRAFLKAIPIAKELANKKSIDISFGLIGQGPLSGEVREWIDRHPQFKVDFEATNDPLPALSKSKIILSLQPGTNYPSQSLLEGMSAGCVPVITDVGDSRRMADPTFAAFVSLDNLPQQVAERCVEILSEDHNTFAAKSAAASEFVAKHFSLSESVKYYEKFYGLIETE